MMRRWLSFVAIVLLALVLLIGAACGGGEEEEGVTELKYGIGLPLTGVYGAAVGLPCKYAYEMSADKIGVFEVAGKQYRWKIVFEENMFSIQGGAASATKLIMAQRMTRKICTGCRTEVTVTPEVLNTLGLNEDEARDLKVFAGQGCADCNGTGLAGRTGIFEVMPISPTIERMIPCPGDSGRDVCAANGRD